MVRLFTHGDPLDDYRARLDVATRSNASSPADGTVTPQEVHEGVAATGFRGERRRLTAIVTSGGDLEVDAVGLAAGAHTATLSRLADPANCWQGVLGHHRAAVAREVLSAGWRSVTQGRRRLIDSELAHP